MRNGLVCRPRIHGIVVLLLALGLTGGCSTGRAPPADDQLGSGYTLTPVTELEDKGALLDLGHDFAIQLDRPGQATQVVIPLDHERLRGIDGTNLYLARVVDGAGSLAVVDHLVPTRRNSGEATIKESGTYTLVGLPRRAGDYFALRWTCDFSDLAAFRSFENFDRICLVIDCPGDFQSPSVCDRCFQGALSLPPPECGLPRFPPPRPPPARSTCPVAPANGYSSNPSVSPDGQVVVFASGATNLVPNDNNHSEDVFLRDRGTCQTELISQNSTGHPGNGYSYAGGGRVLSADKRFVVFVSAASNMAAAATGHETQVYVRDRKLGLTELVSVDSSGALGNDDSTIISRGGISADGRYVSFASAATNLVPNDTNSTIDVFVHDREIGRTERVSVGNDGTQAETRATGGELSADGRYVLFASDSGNLTTDDTTTFSDIFMRDRLSRSTIRISRPPAGVMDRNASWSAALSDDGNRVAFSSSGGSLGLPDTNGATDVYVFDRATGSRWRATVARNGDPSLGGVGSGLNRGSERLSGNGRYVVFVSESGHLVDSGRGSPRRDTRHVFRRDLLRNQTERVSVDERGAPANASSARPQINRDGTIVVFASFADGLVPGDTNPSLDIYLRDMATGAMELISVGLTTP